MKTTGNVAMRTPSWSQMSTSQRFLIAGHVMGLASFAFIAYGNLLSMLENDISLPTQPITPSQSVEPKSSDSLYGGRRPNYFTS